VDIQKQNQLTVHCKLLTDSGQTVEDSTGHSDTSSVDCKLLGTDRQWTECRKEQWTE